jgi:c-di-GMP-binding flagellar brake protein YcgR
MEVLVCHDGELTDVCGMLRELRCAFVERVGAAPLADLARAWDLVVASPARALRLGSALGRPETRSIVVAEPGTRTAGRRLHQLGVEWIVRRPVHQAALRLLLQHTLYRGPERRRAQRVSIGLQIRYRSRWLPRRALLREISMRGASLIASRRVSPGTRIALHLADAGSPITLRGEVVRCRIVAAGEVELGVTFDPHPLAPIQDLRRVMDRYARGPAVCSAPGPVAAAPRSEPAAAAAQPPASDAERREATRHVFPRRVIALGDDAPRVLIGRDLSLGGMAVESGVPLATGQRLKLALHVRAGEVPLVVEAEVVRTNGAGVGLRFETLSESTRGYLAKMLDSLPGLAAPSGGSGEERRVLAELVEG